MMPATGLEVSFQRWLDIQTKLSVEPLATAKRQARTDRAETDPDGGSVVARRAVNEIFYGAGNNDNDDPASVTTAQPVKAVLAEQQNSENGTRTEFCRCLG